MSLMRLGVASATTLLELVLIWFMLLGAYRNYRLLFLYCSLDLITATAELAVFRRFGAAATVYKQLYWTDEILVDSLLFLMMIGFTLRALEGNPARPKAVRFLTGVVMFAVVAPFVVFYQRTIFSTAWFNGTSQFLNFGAAILNLALWSALLLNKKRDPQLLTVSIGLGIAVTGAAMYFGIRQLLGTSRNSPVAEFAGSLARFVGIFVWCWAFRPAFLRDKSNPPGQVTSGVNSPADAR